MNDNDTTLLHKYLYNREFPADTSFITINLTLDGMCGILRQRDTVLGGMQCPTSQFGRFRVYSSLPTSNSRHSIKTVSLSSSTQSATQLTPSWNFNSEVIWMVSTVSGVLGPIMTGSQMRPPAAYLTQSKYNDQVIDEMHVFKSEKPGALHPGIFQIRISGIINLIALPCGVVRMPFAADRWPHHRPSVLEP
jgi:hypothetical protein